jgi:hypothetical protein
LKINSLGVIFIVVEKNAQERLRQRNRPRTTGEDRAKRHVENPRRYKLAIIAGTDRCYRSLVG